MAKQFRTTTSVREVREDLDILWTRAREAGASRPPPSRVTFSREGWLDFLSDPEIRQVFVLTNMVAGVSAFLGAEVVIDVDQCVRFRTEFDRRQE